MRWMLSAAGLLTLGPLLLAQPAAPSDEPAPPTLDAFKAAAATVLEETRVPGAGIALVGVNGVEWAGGVGWADRDARLPVTADTHFRVGSISKTFVAMALVQLYEDGKLDLDAPLRALLPDLPFDNPWEADAPVLLRHVLEHTAGFDDMHFNETYVFDGAPDLPLDEVLFRTPASRRVRWKPGTRMAYANPGYGVAGLVIEKVTGKPFEDVIDERIFAPLEMRTSSFRLAPEDDPALAQGYDAPDGRPVTHRRIYLRPAGALQTSARELGHFVQMLLGWGERNDAYVVDPEYLSNMEWPRTTVASAAGVRAGYGLGIYSTIDLPYHVLGHNGGIDGFLSAYGYSPSRDVGFVVLLNATHAPEALTRLSALALRYLKRDVATPAKESMTVPAARLGQLTGYYHRASPRRQVRQALEYPLSGLTVTLDGDHLVMTPTLDAGQPLVPVNDGLFRVDDELTASLAFTMVDDALVLAGNGVYAERRSRWPFDVLRAGLAAGLAAVVLAPLAAAVAAIRPCWRPTPPGGGRGLGRLWALAAGVLALVAWAASTADIADLAEPSLRSWTIFVGTAAYPAVAAVVAGVTARAWRRGPALTSGWCALAVMLAHAGLSIYLGWWELIGFRSWVY